MKTFRVWKTLGLHVDVEAETVEGAINKMLDMDDTTFVVDDCDYGADEIEDAT